MAKVKNHIFINYLLVLAIGLTILVIFYFQSFPKLSWSDEIVYAVMGRNIATGRGVISNFYHPDSIAEKGFPLGDVHVPGHAFFLALSFLMLGPTEYAAIFPNQLSYLVGGLILFWVGHRLFTKQAGFFIALLFYLFPPLITYSHSAMAELTLTLVSIVYFALWIKAVTQPNLFQLAVLALVLGLGMTIRETFLVFLPSAWYALWLWPRAERVKAGVYFSLVFIAYTLFIFWPFYQARAPHPHFLSNLFELESPSLILQGLWENVLTNLKNFPFFGQAAWQQAYTVQYLLMVVIASCYFTFSTIQKRIAIFVLFGYIGTFLGLVAVYPLSSWAGVRAFTFLMPPALVLVGSMVSRLNSAWLRYGTFSLVAGLLLYISVQGNQVLTLNRVAEHERGQRYSEFLTAYTAHIAPQTVMMKGAFLYGWQAYPVNVIWKVTTDPATARVLERTTPIDVIVVGEEGKERFTNAIKIGVLSGDYQLVNQNSLQEESIFINVGER